MELLELCLRVRPSIHYETGFWPSSIADMTWWRTAVPLMPACGNCVWETACIGLIAANFMLTVEVLSEMGRFPATAKIPTGCLHYSHRLHLMRVPKFRRGLGEPDVIDTEIPPFCGEKHGSRIYSDLPTRKTKISVPGPRPENVIPQL